MVALPLPGAVLHRRRKPNPLVPLLKLLLFCDLLPRRHLRVLRLGWARKVVPVEIRRRDDPVHRLCAFRTRRERRVGHPVPHLVDDETTRAFVLVDGHRVPPDARRSGWPAVPRPPATARAIPPRAGPSPRAGRSPWS